VLVRHDRLPQQLPVLGGARRELHRNECDGDHGQDAEPAPSALGASSGEPCAGVAL